MKATPEMTGTPAAPAPELDGRHDFDFLAGSWRIANRKLEHPLDEQSSRWLEFESTAQSQPILGGLGNFDEYSAPDFPGSPGFRGLALRLFDAESLLWRIWWASTSGGGRLDTPVVGRFREGRGRFECDDVIDGVPLKIRFDWSDITPSAARWEQIVLVRRRCELPAELDHGVLANRVTGALPESSRQAREPVRMRRAGGARVSEAPER